MISNRLYSSWRLVKDRLIQNIWVSGIFFVGCLFTLPIQSALVIQRYISDIENKYATRGEAQEYILRIVGQENSFLKLTIILIAMIMGWALFSYLHSKKQIDFYHSLPISRGRIFINNFLAGNIIFFFTYMINLIMAIVIIGFMGFGSNIDYLEVVKALLINTIFFNLIFSISTLAGIITGTRLTHILMTGVILEYLQMLVLLVNEYLGYFFKTFYSDELFTDKLMISLSPLSNYFSDFSYGMLIGQFMLVVIIILLNIYIFTIRPSETSGKALLNIRLKIIMKYAILSLGSMAGGLIFYEVGQSKSWMIFGLFFSCIIGHCILESLLNFNMKSMLANKRKLVLFMGLSTLIFILLDMDLMKYDLRMPEMNAIESVSINPVNFDEYTTYYENNSNFNQNEIEDNSLDKVKLSNPQSIKSIVDISKISIANQEAQDNENSYVYDKYLQIVVKFNLKDGKSMVRHYRYAPVEESLPMFAKIFDTQEFKYRYYPVLNLNLENVTKATIEFPEYTSIDEEQPNISEVLKKERIGLILEAVQNDFLKIKSKNLEMNNPIALLTFYEEEEKEETLSLFGSKNEPYERRIEVPVFKEYEETLKMLSAYGYNRHFEIKPEMISYVKLYTYDENSDSKDVYYNPDEKSANKENVKILNTQSEIEKFLKEYVLNFNTNLNPFLKTDTNSWATVYLRDDNSSGYDFTLVKDLKME